MVKIEGDVELNADLPIVTSEWVSLTEDKWFEIWEDSGTDMNWQTCREIAQELINAKLKEKNSV